MNKQEIIKWSKRIGIVMGSIMSIFLIILIYQWGHYTFYEPIHRESLYKQGLNDIRKSDSIAILLYNMNRTDEALNILKNAAEKGNTSSAVLLGRYYKGYDIQVGFTSSWRSKRKEDLEKCSYWYLQAAKKGNAEAQGELGHNYKYGIGVQQDFSKAIYWLELGAKGGNSVAQWRLGNLYLNGLALYDIDFLHSNYWYNGNDEFVSLDNEVYKVKDSYLKEILNSPTKVYFERNIEEAKHYWRLAANQGLQEAKDALEKVYE